MTSRVIGLGRQPCGAEQVEEVGHQDPAEQLRRGDVQRQVHIEAARPPRGQVGQRTRCHLAAEGEHQPLLPGQRQEHRRWHHPLPGVVPAGEGLESIDRSRGCRHDRLVPDVDPLRPDRLPQVVGHLKPVPGERVGALLVDLDAAVAGLRRAQGHVGMSHQVDGALVGGLPRRDADARPDRHGQTLDHHRLGHERAGAAGDLDQHDGVVGGGDHGEHVTAGACEEGACRKDLSDAMRHDGQQVVAGHVPQGVVDLPELVDVDEQDARALTIGDAPPEPVLDRLAVRQAREVVGDGPSEVVGGRTAPRAGRAGGGRRRRRARSTPGRRPRARAVRPVGVRAGRSTSPGRRSRASWAPARGSPSSLPVRGVHAASTMRMNPIPHSTSISIVKEYCSDPRETMRDVSASAIRAKPIARLAVRTGAGASSPGPLPDDGQGQHDIEEGEEDGHEEPEPGVRVHGDQRREQDDGGQGEAGAPEDRRIGPGSRGPTGAAGLGVEEDEAGEAGVRGEEQPFARCREGRRGHDLGRRERARPEGPQDQAGREGGERRPPARCGGCGAPRAGPSG